MVQPRVGSSSTTVSQRRTCHPILRLIISTKSGVLILTTVLVIVATILRSYNADYYYDVFQPEQQPEQPQRDEKESLIGSANLPMKTSLHSEYVQQITIIDNQTSVPPPPTQQQQQQQTNVVTSQVINAITDTKEKKKPKIRNRRRRRGNMTNYAIFNESELVVVVDPLSSSSSSSSTITEHGSPFTTMKEKPYVPVLQDDFIYSRSGWNSAPIVLNSHKLLFFTVQKCGCTVWKQLARRMMGYEDWRTKGPADPRKNGLRYLYHYNLTEATRLMNSQEYTRAIFVRDPKEKFLSAFIDKAYSGIGQYAIRRCGCRFKENNERCRKRYKNFTKFVEVTRRCRDSHWGRQSERIDTKFIATIDFVGHFDTIEEDTVQLLKQINAYEEFGSNGWGKYGNESIFRSTGTVKHASGKTAKLLSKFYTPRSEQEIETRFANDYKIPQFNLTKRKIQFTS